MVSLAPPSRTAEQLQAQTMITSYYCRNKQKAHVHGDRNSHLFQNVCILTSENNMTAIKKSN